MGQCRAALNSPIGCWIVCGGRIHLYTNLLRNVQTNQDTINHTHNSAHTQWHSARKWNEMNGRRLVCAIRHPVPYVHHQSPYFLYVNTNLYNLYTKYVVLYSPSDHNLIASHASCSSGAILAQSNRILNCTVAAGVYRTSKSIYYIHSRQAHRMQCNAAELTSTRPVCFVCYYLNLLTIFCCCCCLLISVVGLNMNHHHTASCILLKIFPIEQFFSFCMFPSCLLSRFLYTWNSIFCRDVCKSVHFLFLVFLGAALHFHLFTPIWPFYKLFVAVHWRFMYILYSRHRHCID